jgi:hypothetical protein
VAVDSLVTKSFQNVGSDTLSVTVGAGGTQRALLVIVHGGAWTPGQVTGPGRFSVSSITYAGQPLTLFKTVDNQRTRMALPLGNLLVHYYVLLDPPAGTANVAATFGVTSQGMLAAVSLANAGGLYWPNPDDGSATAYALTLPMSFPASLLPPSSGLIVSALWSEQTGSGFYPQANQTTHLSKLWAPASQAVAISRLRSRTPVSVLWSMSGSYVTSILTSVFVGAGQLVPALAALSQRSSWFSAQ